MLNIHCEKNPVNVCGQIPVTVEDPAVYPEIEQAFRQAGFATVSGASTA